MAAFATPAELASHLKVPSVDTSSAVLALDIISGEIRSYCGWSITQESNTVRTFDGPGGRSLWLSTLKLTAVASVVEDGVTLTVIADYDWTLYGKLIREGRWSCKPRSIVVTYTHGEATTPDAVKGVCLVASGELYQNPELLKSLTVGGVSETRGGSPAEAGALLTEGQRTSLGPFQLPMI